MLNSLQGQAYPFLRHSIHDAGSTDETNAILSRSLPDFSRLIIARDDGQTDAINQGLNALSDCEILSWLNADDMLLPCALSHVANYFAQHPEVDALYGNRLIIDEGGQEIGRWVLPKHDKEMLFWSDFIPQETVFFRANLWRKVGGLNKDFHFAMDWDLWLRFQKAGAVIHHIPHFLGAFRVQPEQKTQTLRATTGEQEYQKIWREHLGYVPNIWAIHKALIPYYIKHLAAHARLRISEFFQD